MYKKIFEKNDQETSKSVAVLSVVILSPSDDTSLSELAASFSSGFRSLSVLSPALGIGAAGVLLRLLP